MDPETDLRLSTDLLRAELPDPRFVDTAYLRWLYLANPYGPAIQGRVDEDGPDGEPWRVGHYALVPARYRDPDGPVEGAFSLNAVSRSGQQRRGHFRTLGNEIYAEASRRGWRFVVGVTNAKSTGAVVKYLGWRLVGGMPVHLLPPVHRSPASVEHHRVTPGFLTSHDFDRLTVDLDAVPANGWSTCYTQDYLRWRLACPHTSYVVHASDDLVAVSTRTRQFGVPAAVVLKLLPRGGRTGPISPNGLIAAITRHHRAPYAVYAGHNTHVPVRGIEPPRRLLPSPLNVIIRSFQDDLDQNSIELDVFEFLDMDAY